MTLPGAKRLARLRLARTDQSGRATFRRLVEWFSTMRRALESRPALIRREDIHRHSLRSVAPVEAEIEGGERVGTGLIVLGEADHPDLLAAINPPPPLLLRLRDL